MQEPATAQQVAQQISILGIRPEGWLTIIAVILGPILAVQAQKIVERRRELRNRKLHLFRELMATRGSRLSQRHVEALNLIEMEYAPSDEKQRPVFEAWRSYFDLLSQPAPELEAQQQLFFERRNDAFIDVLYTMGRYLGFSFDKVAIRRNSYVPTLHGETEMDAITIRKALVDLLTNKKALNVWAALFPDHPAIKVEIVDAATAPTQVSSAPLSGPASVPPAPLPVRKVP
jgi:hypothetical protein